MADTKWVSCWGNATSIIDQKECVYSKDITLRYPIFMCFDGSKVRLRFSNLTGVEPVHITKVTVASSVSDRDVDESTITTVTFAGNEYIDIEAGQEATSDEVAFDVKAGSTMSVSIYLGTYTNMNSGVLITGPLSKGFCAYGNHASAGVLPIDKTRNTNWFYFLNTIDVFTKEKNHALICYGDSITAQSWPDYLTKMCYENGINDVSIIRRAVSGTRILRQYDCTTYAAYGLKGETRFPIEMNVAGADTVLIQHGINDIIHPVGEDVNVFRPWSDMPSYEDLVEGVKNLYIEHARKLGYKVYLGTLLPIYGWRTYADFRDELRVQFNDWMRDEALIGRVDGLVDFDKALCDKEDPRKFAPGFDSGDHLHPSESAYEEMARTALEVFSV
ncbi:MAG: GDSL-type esterase/lipase family protein [Saccharofermentans sp.]|nr:GDSL-type esterase/lipase family protein [Saccharofermentans sp.]